MEDLHGFTADFIRHELLRRNLETTGSKEDMIERVLHDIARNCQPSGGPDSTAEQSVYSTKVLSDLLQQFLTLHSGRRFLFKSLRCPTLRLPCQPLVVTVAFQFTSGLNSSVPKACRRGHRLPSLPYRLVSSVALLNIGRVWQETISTSGKISRLRSRASLGTNAFAMAAHSRQTCPVTQ